MEQREFLRTRVSERLKNDFDDICKEHGKTPTEQLRELIEGFVRQEVGALRDRVSVHIFRPAGYDLGVWRVTMKLRHPEALTWMGAPVPFALPSFQKRLLDSDQEYIAVVFDPETNEPGLGGQFVNGEWRGRLQTNGCHENDNPTSIETVRKELTSMIVKILDRFGDAASTA